MNAHKGEIQQAARRAKRCLGAWDGGGDGRRGGWVDGGIAGCLSLKLDEGEIRDVGCYTFAHSPQEALSPWKRHRAWRPRSCMAHKMAGLLSEKDALIHLDITI